MMKTEDTDRLLLSEANLGGRSTVNHRPACLLPRSRHKCHGASARQRVLSVHITPRGEETTGLHGECAEHSLMVVTLVMVLMRAAQMQQR